LAYISLKNTDIVRPLKNLTFPATLRKRVDFYEVTGVRALSFRNLLVGETAGPNVLGQCGGGKTPPQISCRKDQPGSLGTEEKPILFKKNIGYTKVSLLRTQYVT